MVTINSTLNNFFELPVLIDVLGQFSNDYEYTTRGIFEKNTPLCPFCNNPMIHNGYNFTLNKVLEKST